MKVKKKFFLRLRLLLTLLLRPAPNMLLTTFLIFTAEMLLIFGKSIFSNFEVLEKCRIVFIRPIKVKFGLLPFFSKSARRAGVLRSD